MPLLPTRFGPPIERRLRQLAIGAGYHSRPHFLIIGAQKAGTTALYYYLADHPDVVPSTEKEVGFFAPEPFADWPEHPNHSALWVDGRMVFEDPASYRRALAWYHGHFPLPHELGGGRLTFEATPEYLYYPGSADRIFRYDPTIKLIALLRDPVERAFSAWNMYRGFGDYRPLIYAPRKEGRDFETAVRDELKDILMGREPAEPGYVRRGFYDEQLARYLDRFPRSQILVLDSRELAEVPGGVVDRAFEFLGLPALGRMSWEPMHVGRYEGQVPPRSGGLLRDAFRPHNLRLYELLNHDFGWR